MEQPYSERNLLVCLNGNSDPAVVDALMTDVEQSPWLNITDLNTLNNADPALSGDDAAAIVPQSDGINDATQANLRQTLNTLAASTNDIKRFNASILTDVADDAKQAPAGLKAWRRQLVNAHGIMALHALGGENPAGSTMVEGAGQLASLLINGVAITPTENVNVVSETAQMPITISNSHPYPVTVKVSSLTNSMQIVTSRFDTVEVPAHGEAKWRSLSAWPPPAPRTPRSACRTGRASHSERHKPPTSPAHCRSATKPASSSSASPCCLELWDCGANSTVRRIQTNEFFRWP